ncbi:MAG: PAS domain S-box-containing protein [Natrialbaceae archaeon]|jgi:PAS domain S-box-containing protein
MADEEAHRNSSEGFDSEELLAVAENVQDAIIAIDSNQEIRFWNDAAEETFGYAGDNVLGEPVHELLAPAKYDQAIASGFQQFIETGEGPVLEETVELDAQKRDGTIVPVELSVNAYEKSGQQYAVAVVRDIAERKERERNLRESWQTYQTLFDGINDAVFVHSFGGEFLAVNDTACERLEYDEDELLGISPFEIDAHEHREEIEHRLESIRQGGELTFETVHLTKSGTRIPVEITANRVQYFGEDAILAVARDISGRKRREQALAALHDAAKRLEAADSEDEVYETVVEVADDILEFEFVSVDIVEDDQLVMQAMVDETSGEYYGSVPLDPDETLGARAYLRGETILADDLQNYDVAPADPDYRSALTIPMGEFGTVQAGAREANAFDETDRELAELLVDHARVALQRIQYEASLREQRERLQRENERLDQFASIVSHDLRNPLTVAHGQLELATQDGDDPHLDEVAESLERLDSIITDALTMAREGKTVDETDLESIDLEAVANDCWLAVDTARADLRVETSATVRADRDRLRRAIENLYRNAVEHGSTSPPSQAHEDALEHGGEDVTITVGDLDSEGFYVADDGRGIPVDKRDQVFESGFSTSEAGTGFGLAIVREIVEAHGWDVRVTESEAGGARFEVTGI